MQSIPLTEVPGTAGEQASHFACTQPEWFAPAPVHINTHANNGRWLVIRWQAIRQRRQLCASAALSCRKWSSERNCQLR